ncbi:MAG: NAD-dependent epimerase/dehydratase family protein [Proteobacteria bacterium]|nr:NAD-dependent epimerase/dehydratase family protein [Pseudomonadota bacterium]
MRVLIAGGAGFLGSHLCDRFIAEGHAVVCLDSLITGRAANVAHLEERGSFQIVRGSVCDAALLASLGRFEAILHFASPASPIDYVKMPFDTVQAGSTGTWALLDLARAHGARFMLASTSEIYGEPLEHPQTERYWGNVNPIGVRSVYDESKRFSEMLTALYHREHGLDTIIIRIFNTYGPRMRVDDGRVVTTFISQALRGEPLTVNGDGTQTRSMCFHTDLVDGIHRALASGEHAPINLGNPEETTMRALADTVIALTRSTSRITRRDMPPDDPSRRCPDISRARAVLGWEPQVRLADGLAATISWVESEIGGA